MTTNYRFGIFSRFFVLAFVMVAFFFNLVSAQAQNKTSTPSAQKFTVQQLQSDLKMLRTTFESAHGGIYRHTPKPKLDSVFNSVEKSLLNPLNELQFYRLLSPLIDLIHDAHTSMTLSKKTFQFLGKEGKVFPLDVRYQNEKLFVEKNFDETNPDLKPGCEIISIDGVSIKKITQTLLQAKTTDGSNTSAKLETANSAFWLMYYEMISDNSIFKIKVLDKDTKTIKSYVLKGVSGRVIQQNQFTVQNTDSFTIDYTGKIAIMRIPTFLDLSLYQKLDLGFKQIMDKKIENLIIDLRNNGGGYDDLNTTLLSYLIPHPFQFYKGYDTRANQWKDIQNTTFESEDFFNQNDLKNIPASELDARLKQKSLKEALDYYMNSNPAMGIHNPNPSGVFKGQVYLLFNGGSTSSGGEVPALMHFYGIGTLVGEEPNSYYGGTTAGVLTKMTLPETGLRFVIPLVAYKNNVIEGMNCPGGAKPHFEVSQTIDDAIKEKDTVMEFVMKLIEQRSK